MLQGPHQVALPEPADQVVLPHLVVQPVVVLMYMELVLQVLPAQLKQPYYNKVVMVVPVAETDLEPLRAATMVAMVAVAMVVVVVVVQMIQDHCAAERRMRLKVLFVSSGATPALSQAMRQMYNRT